MEKILTILFVIMSVMTLNLKVVTGLQCQYCQGDEQHCNTKNVPLKTCPPEQGYVCLLHIDKSKVYTSPTEYIEEIHIRKNCAVEDPLYCQKRKSSKALHLDCEVLWCYEDQCNSSKKKIRAIQQNYQSYFSNGEVPKPVRWSHILISMLVLTKHIF